MSWAYNQIDVYISTQDNILGETSVNTNSWVPLSIYGILRGRPVLTPSTVEGDKVTITGRDGRSVSTISSRANAKLEFEILAVDAWPFATLKAQGITVRKRIDILKALLNNTVRITYKEPGRDPDSFFIVYSTTLTLTDADEKAQSIKVSMELHPFEYWFSGNTQITVAASGSYTFTNQLPDAECYPIYQIPADVSGQPNITVNNNVLAYTPNTVITTGLITIDTFDQLAYYSPSVNPNRYFNGSYDKLTFPVGSNVVHNNTNKAIYIYTRKGMTL